MGTRADFYVGRGPNAEWVGSVAWDGYPEGFAVNSIGEFENTLHDIERTIKYLNEYDGQSKGMSFDDAIMLKMYAIPLQSALKTLTAYRPEGLSETTYPVFTATTEAAFREAISEHVAIRENFSGPEDGWPWPWDDSETTDYAYAFDEDKVWGYSHEWFDVAARLAETDDETEALVEPVRQNEEYAPIRRAYPFPDMNTRKNVQMNSTKGGIMLVSSDGAGGLTVK